MNKRIFGDGICSMVTLSCHENLESREKEVWKTIKHILNPMGAYFCTSAQDVSASGYSSIGIFMAVFYWLN